MEKKCLDIEDCQDPGMSNEDII